MPKDGLTDKQKEFVRQYLIDFNASQAAVRSGYSKRRSGEIGWQLLQKTTIQDAIAMRAKELIENADITPESVIAELGLIYRTDIADFFTWTEDGAFFIPSDQIPADKRRAISEVQADTVTRTDENGNVERTVKLRLKTWDKMKAIEKLGQYFKLFIERQELNINIRVEERLTMALARMEARRATDHGQQIANN